MANDNLSKFEIWESRNKYGDWDGDLDEFGDLLAGNKRNRPRELPRVSTESTLDETFLREIGNSRDKYGR